TIVHGHLALAVVGGLSWCWHCNGKPTPTWAWADCVAHGADGPRTRRERCSFIESTERLHVDRAPAAASRAGRTCHSASFPNVRRARQPRRTIGKSSACPRQRWYSPSR